MTRAYNTATTQQNTGGAVAGVTAGKNFIINGDFAINQRNFTSVSSGYGFDRWAYQASGSTGTYTPQTFTAGTAPVAGYESKNFARLTVTTGNDFARLEQPIEDVRTFAGQTAVISFWAKGTNPTTAGNLTATVAQYFGTGGSPSATVRTIAGTFVLTANWTRYTLTVAVPSISGKTFGTTIDNNLQVSFGQEASTSADAWTLDIWGIQIEVGSVATPFTTATGTIQGELAACQRYFRIVSSASGVGSSTTQIQSSISHPGMRTTPSVALTAVATFTDCAVADYTQSSATMTISNNDADGGRYQNSNFTGITTLRPYILLSSGGKVQLSAEL